jgi:hypothetical protein
MLCKATWLTNSMEPLTVTAASVVARKVFDLLADDLALTIKSKLRRDPAERAFESATAAAVQSYRLSSDDRDKLGQVLLGERGLLAEDTVAAELAQIVRFDREPDASVIAKAWRERIPDATSPLLPPDEIRQLASDTDFSAEAEELLTRIRVELRGTEIFRPVLDSQSLDAIGAALNKLHDTISADERDVVRHLVDFLEDRRILYDPATGHSVAGHFVYVGIRESGASCLSPAAKGSIQDIRRRIGVAIDELLPSTPGIDLLKRMQATCRWALDVAERPQIETVRSDLDNAMRNDYTPEEVGMTFLGVFRKKFGHDLRLLTDTYQIDVRGPLKDILAMDALYDPAVLADAGRLFDRYAQKHLGFKEMEEGWYEKLCEELESARQPWSS